jgi:hypothetical protein
MVDVTYGYDVTDSFVDDSEAVCSSSFTLYTTALYLWFSVHIGYKMSI